MRRQAVAFFLGDAAFLADARFRALARRLPDPDEMNSAIGAFWSVVAAARRNGSPEIDAAAESGSRYIGDLVAVGLLCATGVPEKSWGEWAPKSPSAVAGGVARAASASRDAGRFARTLVDAGDAGGSPQLAGSAGALVQPSPPLPSTPLLENGTAREVSDDPADAYWSLTGRYPTGRTLAWIDDLAGRYGQAATSRAVALAFTANSDPSTLLSRAKNALAAEARALDRKEAEDEAARLREKRARPKVVEPWQEQYRAMIAERYG